MPIYAGSSKIKEIYAGSRKIGKVYKGSTLVFQSIPRLFQQGNVGRYTLNPVKIGSPVFIGYFEAISSISGQLGVSGSSLLISNIFPYASFIYHHTERLEGYLFYVYRKPDSGQIGGEAYDAYVSPGQRVGDYVPTMWGIYGAQGVGRVIAISGNTATEQIPGATQTDTFTITNTPVNNYIYRP